MKEEKEKALAIVLTMLILVSMGCPSALAANAEATVTILNSEPSVDVALTPDDNPVMPGVQVINPDPSTNKTVTIIANVTDMNGWGDLTSVVTATITGPSIVVDSPVNLTFDYVINITTAIYKGSFNMSNHSEGEYKVEITATDAGGLTGIGSKNFTYSYGILYLYAIWANSTTDKHTIHWSGSKNVVNGNVHSNNDIKVSGSSNMIIGTTEYVSTFTDSGSNNTFIPPPIKVSPQPFPIQYDISEYAPGGPEAVAAGSEGKYHYIKKDFHVSGSGVVLDGLYYVEGNVKLSGSNISGVFTIVAEKKIDVSGSELNCSAYSTNLLFLSGKDEEKGKDKDKGEIKIAGSKGTFCGIIYTKEGKIDLSGSTNIINGGIFADIIKLSGSGLNINAEATGGEIYSSGQAQTSSGGNNIIDAIKAILNFFW
jgi:hypothetical protein